MKTERSFFCWANDGYRCQSAYRRRQRRGVFGFLVMRTEHRVESRCRGRVGETEITAPNDQVSARPQAAAKVCNGFLEIGETDQAIATLGRVYPQIAMARH